MLAFSIAADISIQYDVKVTQYLRNFYMPSSDCYNIASDYKGTIDKTAGGVSCQLWSENFPHEHEFHDDATFPESNVTAASNYCRSPDNGTVPWCYTNDTDVRWDYCNVPICRGMNLQVTVLYIVDWSILSTLTDESISFILFHL